MNHSNNFQDIKLYITEQYCFTSQTFPLLKKCNQPEKDIFIIKHCLLRLHQELYTFIIESEKILFGMVVDVEYSLVKASAEIMIAILKIAEVTNTPLELHTEKWKYNRNEDYKDIVKYAGMVAVHCTAFDRKELYDSEKLKTATEQLWKEFIRIINVEKLLFYEELYRIIPLLL